MKATFNAEIIIDKKLFAEMTADIEIPENDEKNADEFNKNFQHIIKQKFMENQDAKDLALFLVDQKVKETGMLPTDAVDDFFDNRMQVIIKM